mmetsp:Transcript_15453/g.38944  ORF Transcript_15453/g.38944 Transcript_15453/m.38944 type:complete len:112 (-) Transcript_15453:7-342(-)
MTIHLMDLSPLIQVVVVRSEYVNESEYKNKNNPINVIVGNEREHHKNSFSRGKNLSSILLYPRFALSLLLPMDPLLFLFITPASSSFHQNSRTFRNGFSCFSEQKSSVYNL